MINPFMSQGQFLQQVLGSQAASNFSTLEKPQKSDSRTKFERSANATRIVYSKVNSVNDSAALLHTLRETMYQAMGDQVDFDIHANEVALSNFQSRRDFNITNINVID